MSKACTPTGRTAGATRLTLKVWHPDCWTLEATEEANAGVIAHTVYNSPGEIVKGHFTVYADRIDDIDELIDAAKQSRLTDSVVELSPRHEFDKDISNIGNTTREIMVEYNPDNSMTESLLSHGFVHDAPVRVYNGREYWPVIDTNERNGLEERLDSLRDEKTLTSPSPRSQPSQTRKTTSHTNKTNYRIDSGRFSNSHANVITMLGRGKQPHEN